MEMINMLWNERNGYKRQVGGRFINNVNKAKIGNGSYAFFRKIEIVLGLKSGELGRLYLNREMNEIERRKIIKLESDMLMTVAEVWDKMERSYRRIRD